MKVGIYTRISTSEKDQNIETQLLPLRDFAISQGWEIFAEYQDGVPATDLAHRFQWQQLLSDASKHKFDLLLVWRMDRAFRSVLDAATTWKNCDGGESACGHTLSHGWILPLPLEEVVSSHGSEYDRRPIPHHRSLSMVVAASSTDRKARSMRQTRRRSNLCLLASDSSCCHWKRWARSVAGTPS